MVSDPFSAKLYKSYLDRKKEKCPYRIGQFVYAQFVKQDWILSKIVGISYGDEKIKIHGVGLHSITTSVRKYHDRVRTLTAEEEMILMLES